jgi:FkbM family methyltransferase
MKKAEADNSGSAPMECYQLRFGDLALYVPTAEPHTYYGTYLAGEWDCLRIREGDVIMDAGANIGDFTVKAAIKTGPKGLVIAVEPSPLALEYLYRNVELNGLENVIVCNAFIASGMEPRWVRKAGSYLVEGSPEDPLASPIPTTSLSEILDKCAVGHLDVLKMDIEGSESTVFGDAPFLSSVRELAVETHSRSIEASVRRSLASQGFHSKAFNRNDLLRRAAGAILSHPLSLLQAELVTRGYAMRRLTSLAGRNPDVPALLPDSGIRIYYCWRADAPPHVQAGSLSSSNADRIAGGKPISGPPSP